jgi:hypothetical protein
MNKFTPDCMEWLFFPFGQKNLTNPSFYSSFFPWAKKHSQFNFILIFFSTLEFQNFFLCERILINVKTKRPANFKDFKPFGAFKGLGEQKKKNVFNSFVCKLGSLYGARGLLKRSFTRELTNSLNKLLQGVSKFANYEFRAW